MCKDLSVKKPNELIKMRGEFKESELKLSTYLISILEEEKYLYKINIKDYLNKFDKKMGDFEKLHQTARALTNKQFEMVDRVNKKFAIYNFLTKAIYENGILTIKFDDELHLYLMQIKKNYLRYQIKNIMSLNSKYSIRLYEILKNKYEQAIKFQQNIYLETTIDELKKDISVPLSYKYGMFKKNVLEKSKKELKEHTDIFFDYEEIKKGRKIDKIKFIIFKKLPDDEDLEISQENKENKNINNWNDWRKELLKKGDLVLILEDKKYELKNNYLYQNKKLLNKDESLKIWQNLYENRAELQIINEAEYLQEQTKKAQEQKNNYKQIEKLREEFEGKNILGKINNDPIAEYIVSTLQLNNEIKKIELFLMDNSTKEQKIILFPNSDILEDFLQKSRQNYLEDLETYSDLKNNNDSLNEDNQIVNKVAELKNKHINKILLIELDEDESLEVEVLDIKISNDNDIELHLNLADEEVIKSFELNDNDINRLKNFLETCRKAYLATQKRDIKQKLNSIINRF
jgi:plasmid replication initiation protein